MAVLSAWSASRNAPTVKTAANEACTPTLMTETMSALSRVARIEVSNERRARMPILVSSRSSARLIFTVLIAPRARCRAEPNSPTRSRLCRVACRSRREMSRVAVPLASTQLKMVAVSSRSR